VITVDKACQALPNDVKERIERGKHSIGSVTHRSTPMFGTPTLTARAVSILHGAILAEASSVPGSAIQLQRHSERLPAGMGATTAHGPPVASLRGHQVSDSDLSLSETQSCLINLDLQLFNLGSGLLESH
jgi:hypothetical protein